MHVNFSPLDVVADRDDLVVFMTSNDFPFHAGPAPRQTSSRIGSIVANTGTLTTRHSGSTSTEMTAWGLSSLKACPDSAPMFDIRLASAWRGMGIGTAVTALADLVFTR